jgi:uncharacterized protein GlcG (DUF336 family)
MRKNGSGALVVVLLGAMLWGGGTVRAGQNLPSGQGNGACRALPSWDELRAALIAARNADNGGLNLDMWGTIVNRDGIVCAVAFTGGNRGDQWPASRVISAQKANTANSLSLPGLAIATANLYTAVQPGGSLFGVQESNPVSTTAAYSGNPGNYGQKNDPMVGERIGGINVFGGGLALYNASGQLLGGLGVSGDTSCADHNIAWRTRNALNLDYVPQGVAAITGLDPTRKDNIVFDIVPQGGGDAAPGSGQMPGVSPSGWGHASCKGYSVAGNTASRAYSSVLPPTK